ncbi:MAG: beta-N-acetylhexosaminidase [Candidatus Auribacterota bacterium]
MNTHNNFTIGELIVVGFEGTEPTHALVSEMELHGYGGIILFSRNVYSFEQARTLINGFQQHRIKAGRNPLWVAIDEEGGTVSRMPVEEYTLPGARAMAQCGDTNLVYQSAKRMGQLLRYIGVTANFAPVLDVNTISENPGIGIRSFGSTAQEVCTFSIPFIHGMHEAGIFACAKHFPGKGEIVRDSHTSLPVCDCSLKSLNSVHIPPFLRALEAGVQFVMTSHAIYPALDSSHTPATLSEPILTGLLRGTYGYSGLIVSDDLEMGAIKEICSIEEAAFRAIMAGCDMVLVCHAQDKQRRVHEYLTEKYTEDKDFRARCHESFERIQSVKMKIQESHTAFPELLPEISNSVAAKAISCVKGAHTFKPLNPHEKILVAGTPFRSHVEVEINRKALFDLPECMTLLKERLSSVSLLRWDLVPTEEQRNAVTDFNFSAYDRIIIFTNNARLYPAQQELIQYTLERNPDSSILAVIKNPEDYMLFPEAKTVFLTFGYNKTSIAALVHILCSGIGN